MTSSLVGSEMCIRDSQNGHAKEHDQQTVVDRRAAAVVTQQHRNNTHTSVSYTHLTLPTICSV
eukprot:2907870-Prorocentrum_lima.AAC.1